MLERDGKRTIYDIAKIAGCSPATISRVANNKPGVSAASRKRIEKLLREYNFVPSEVARSLSNQDSKMIGFLMADIRTIYDEAYYGVESQFKDHGYCCLIMNTGEDEAEKIEYIRILSQRRVEGAILVGSSFQTKAVETAIRKYLSDIPVVIVNGYLDLPNVYGILADEKNGVLRCVEFLAQKGHCNLAFIIDKDNESNRLKLEGFYLGVRALDAAKAPIVYRCESTLDSAEAVTHQVLDEQPDVDGIIYSWDLLAVGGLRALSDRKVTIPGQIAVMGIDNLIFSRVCSPRLSSLDTKLGELAHNAGRTLIDILQGKKVSQKVMILSTISEQETT